MENWKLKNGNRVRYEAKSKNCRAQGHLIRHSFVVTPSPTGEGLGDVMLSKIVLNKAKIPAF